MSFKLKCDFEFIVMSDDCVVCYAKPTWWDRTSCHIDAAAWSLGNRLNMEMPEHPFTKKYKGVAVRNDGDEVDIELAKEIARKKAVRAAIGACKTYIHRANDIIQDFYIRSCMQEMAIERKKWTIDEEIEELAEG